MSCKIYRFTQQRQNVMILVHYLRKRYTGVLRPEIFLQAGLYQISDPKALASSHYGDGDPSGIPVPCIYLHNL